MANRVRLHYVDVVKGILILIVVLRHMENILRDSSYLSSDNEVREYIWSFTNPWITFYMSTFFILTGFCSDFKKMFRSFLVSNVKTLLFPSITLGFISIWIQYFLGSSSNSVPYLYGFCVIKDFFITGGMFWFLTAMFLSKLLLWLLYNKFSMTVTFALSLLSFVTASFLSINTISLPWYILHSLIFLPFMCLGVKMKSIEIQKWHCIVSFILFLLTYLISVHFMKFRPVLSYSIDLSYMTILPCFILCISGSILLIGLCKCFSVQNRVLEFLGRHSLVIYCLHISFLTSLMPAFKCMFESGNMRSSIFAVSIIFVFVVLVSASISELLDSRFLCWVKGKFNFHLFNV